MNQFKWELTDVFQLEGQEFSAFYNTIKGIVSDPTFQDKVVAAQQTLGLVNLAKIADKIFQEKLAAGIIKEIVVPDEQPFTNTPTDAMLDGRN